MILTQSFMGWHLNALNSAHRLARCRGAGFSKVEAPHRSRGEEHGVTLAMRSWARPLLTRIAVFVAAWLVGSSPAAHAQVGPPVVTVAAPLARKVTQWDEYTGRFEAVEGRRPPTRLRLHRQVTFRDGAAVKQNDLLFTIDQRPFQLAVDSAQADVFAPRRRSS